MDMPISGRTRLLCVIGDPVEHTMSPAMHNAVLRDLGLDYTYMAFHVKQDDLEAAVQGFKALHVAGVNVTIPHKAAIMSFLDEIDEVASKIGAINTIKNVDGRLHAKNTDAGGALQALKIEGIDVTGADVLFLGSGGAAKAVAFSLARDVRSITLASIERDMHLARALATELQAHAPDARISAAPMSDVSLQRELEKTTLLVNATPVGMHPRGDESIVKDEWLRGETAVFDLVYNPLETKLVQQAKVKGCKIAHGLDMLVHQGAIAFEWWTGKKPNVDLMKKAAMERLGIVY